MKKRTSRLLSVLLTLVMVLGLIPALGTTAFAARKIEPIHLELKSGENVFDSPDVKAAIAKMTGGRRNSPGYYGTYSRKVYGDSYDTDIVSCDGVAKSEGGALFEVRLMLTNTGEIIDSFQVVLYVNSVRIDQVKITGIDTPVAGQPLDMTAECSTPGIESTEVRWYTLGGDSTRIRVADGAAAEENTVYLVKVSVEPALGYDLVGLDNIIVNGAKTTPESNGDRSIDVTYEFPATGGENYENQNWVTTKKIISEVAVTGVVTPVDGAKPVETCQLGGTGYTLKSMSWYDGSLKMNSAGTFQAGKTYRVCFYLLPEKGYTFNSVDSMTATVNGKTVEVTNVYGEPEQRAMTVNFTYEKPTKTISTVAITGIDAPVIGAKPDTNAVVSTGMTVGRVTWSPADSVFKEGVVYTVTVTVLEEDGYTFESAVTATVNGQTAKYSRTRQAAKLFVSTVSYTFPELEPGRINLTYDPSSVSTAVGKTVTLSAFADIDFELTDDLKIQWYKAASNYYGTGTAISGANDMTYTFKADKEETAYYYCEVSGRIMGEEYSSASDTAPMVRVTVAKAGAPVITTQPKSVSVKEGADVTFTVTAEGEGLSYQWYCEKNGGAAKVGTNGPTYTIKATNVPDDNGTVYYCVIHNKAGEVTSEKVTLTVSKLGAMTTFSDVPAGVWYTAAVDWAVEEEITNGTGGGKFSPTENCTHAQILTFLYRADRGVGTAAAEDMDKAVDWARGKGMIDASFNGAKECTRAEAVEYIWQALGKQDAETSGFTDVDAKADYAKAVDWAVANGVTNGAGGGKFSPNTVCTRGHIVTFLHRAYVPEARV